MEERIELVAGCLFVGDIPLHTEALGWRIVSEKFIDGLKCGKTAKKHI